MRFYDRQFITRSLVNKDILVKFERILEEYFQSEKTQTLGLPTVKYCAENLYLSANYLGDLIKKETGKSPQEHIQLKLMDIAKEKIFDSSKSVSEIAYELGFKHPQHFTRMFKKEIGVSPSDFRILN
jgi:AraC-like DNA-binding protein